MLKQILEKSWRTVYQNKFGLLIGASTLYFAVVGVGLNALSWLLRLALALAKQPNLNKDNFWQLFANPLSLAVLVSYALVVAFLTFIEFTVLINLVRVRRNNERLSVRKIAQKTIARLRKLVGVEMIFFLIFFISIIPFENLGLSSALTERLYIPKFIIGEMSKTNLGEIAYLLIMAVIFYLNFRLILTLPLSILNRKKLSQNIRESWRATREHQATLFLALAISSLILGALALVAILAVSWLFGFIDQTGNNWLINTIFYTTIDAIIFGFLVFAKLIITSILLEFLVEIDGKKSAESKQETVCEQTRRSVLLAGLMVIFLCGTMLYNGFQIYHMNYNYKTLKIAHRAKTREGVENSIESLLASAQAGADYAEIDIQLTRDGHFVVIHDYNLARLAGVNQEVKNLTLAELQTLNLRQDGFESQISTFEDFVAAAKEAKIKLLVEVKPHGGEPQNFAEMIISKMRELDISKEYKVMSLDLELMRQVKNQAPELSVGFVIPLQIGDFDNSNIDFYAIEDFSYTELLAKSAHLKKRQIFVWTVNGESEIEHYLRSAADGIISDEADEIGRIEARVQNGESYFAKAERAFLSQN
ncbi:MAG: glycerophosphodiester phosphodiesterase [bacterium]|nr:glycerophosphodiester phosphodiesterase [bacterium]